MSKIVLCRASVRRAGRKMRRHSSCKNSRSSKMSAHSCHVSLAAAHAESHLQSEGILIIFFIRSNLFLIFLKKSIHPAAKTGSNTGTKAGTCVSFAQKHAMEALLFQVNAFTHRPFGGNPAAVCLTAAPFPTSLMQAIAAEMNLSETAFVHPLAGGHYALRWFTPTTEVALCGHATLATAHVLLSEIETEAAREEVNFETQSGLLTVKKQRDGYAMLFPALPCEAIDVPEGLTQALNASVKACFRSTFDLVVELEDEAAVRSCTPRLEALAAFPYRGVIVTAAGQPPFDFVSRFFGPNCGVAEDPVTGSAHCALAPLWAARLQKTSLRAFQASKRGGIVETELLGEQVILQGAAVTIWTGRLQPHILPA